MTTEDIYCEEFMLAIRDYPSETLIVYYVYISFCTMKVLLACLALAVVVVSLCSLLACLLFFVVFQWGLFVSVLDFLFLFK